jgi:hypothetical protein
MPTTRLRKTFKLPPYPHAYIHKCIQTCIRRYMHAYVHEKVFLHLPQQLCSKLDWFGIQKIVVSSVYQCGQFKILPRCPWFCSFYQIIDQSLVHRTRRETHFSANFSRLQPNRHRSREVGRIGSFLSLVKQTHDSLVT